MSDQRKVVIPGDEVGTSEEFLPGEGTYELEGRIHAKQAGVLFGDEDMTITVKPENPPVTIKDGDIITAVVVDTKEKLLSAEALEVDNSNRSISGNKTGFLHVSRVSEAFTSNIKNEYKVGDIIRARVMQTDPSLQLATFEEDLGVIKAYCVKCRQPLFLRNGKLKCQICERTEYRKISDRYVLREGED